MMRSARVSHADAPVLRRQATRLAWLLASAGCCGVAMAQGAGGSLAVLPRASVSETITDNALLRDSDKRSDAITILTAGVSLTSRGSRTSGALDYQLAGTVHARETKSNRVSQALNATLQSEVIDDFFFINAAAGISQQLISAFGLQDVAPGFDNPNRTEVRSFTVSPSLRGRIGSAAVYDARLTVNRQDSDAGQGDQSGRTQSLTLSSPAGRVVGWNGTLMRTVSDFKEGRSTNYDRALIGLTYQPDPSLRLSLNGGREENDIATVAGQNNNTTWGVAVQWVPSNRTQLSASRDRRFFGDAHSLNFVHRGVRTTFRLSSSRDLQSALPSVNTTLISAYDALFDLFAGTEPDPVAREQLVLRFMQNQGIPATALLPVNFLSSAVTLLNRQEAALAWHGVRSSAVLALARSTTRRLDNALLVGDDFDTETEVRQEGLTLTLGHRLTPVSGLSLTLSHRRNRGQQVLRSTTTNSVQLNWTAQLGPRSSVSLGARRVDFNSTTSPYTENAITATLGVRF